MNIAVGQQDRDRDVRAIQAIARERGYRLMYLLTIGPQTYMPITAIAHEALSRDAVAVVAPSSHHFGEHVEALARAVTLETWAGTVKRVGWDPTR
ncbi:hypothetical protein [Nocardia sp. A7]|uniref:hypothetical protein n=1 Tax=Nocardia sp. A7 TaxID=2789274 RepID=UPI00397E0DCF